MKIETSEAPLTIDAGLLLFRQLDKQLQITVPFA